jgi:hypothetical protein
MKKYIQPSMDVIEMETIGVVATSSDPSAVSIFEEESSDIQLQSRNRGAAWSDYEGP